MIAFGAILFMAGSAIWLLLEEFEALGGVLLFIGVAAITSGVIS